MRWMGRISVKGQRIDEWMKVKLLYIEREWPVYGWRDSGGRWKSIITADKTSCIVVQELGFSSPVGINVKMLMDSAQLQSPEEDAPSVITAFVYTVWSVFATSADYVLTCLFFLSASPSIIWTETITPHVDTSSRWACVLSGMWLDFPSTISRVNVYSIAYGCIRREGLDDPYRCPVNTINRFKILNQHYSL